jgi:hypothetical protein
MTLDTDAPPRLRDADDSASTTDTGLRSHYVRSWAVLIGINDYKHAAKLYTAAADAVGMARALIEQHGFSPGNVYLVITTAEPLPGPLATWLASIQQQLGGLDQRATKQVIEKLLVRTLPSLTGLDDRLVIFLAGPHPAALRQLRDRGARIRPRRSSRPRPCTRAPLPRHAIHRLIETDREQTRQASLQHYIRLGAPLGVDDELLQPRAPARLR